MNNWITTLSVASFFVLSACNKTEQPRATTTNPASEMQMDIEVVVDNDAMTITMNGEEVDGLPDDMMQHVMQMIGNDGSETIVMINADEVEGMPDNMMGHVMHMMSGEKGEHATQMRMMKIMGDEHGGSPEGMHEHTMHTMGGGGHGSPHQFSGEWRSEPPHQMHENGRHQRDLNVSEEMQFMQELGMLREVAANLDGGDSVSLLGIHMIRDELEGELRMEALEAIIEEAGSGSSARNAALIVAIQTLQDAGDNEAAADYMVELVLSN
jgi:hypothetical protein